MAAVLFGVAASALIATAVLLMSSVSHGRAQAEASGVSALMVTDRAQLILAQLNAQSNAAPEARIVQGWMDSSGNTLTPSQADGVEDKTNAIVIAQSPPNQWRISVTIEAYAGHGSAITRQVNFTTIDSDGAITGVDANGRPKYAQKQPGDTRVLPAAGLLWQVSSS